MPLVSTRTSTAAKPLLSVVIGFRNRSLDRLSFALRHHRSRCPEAELIVVDFGSDNGNAVQQVVNRANARYVRCESEIWSRSQALNAGIEAAQSELILTTDIDIIFSENTHERCTSILLHEKHVAVFVQCWNLPKGVSEDIASSMPSPVLSAKAAIRPRSSLGGCCAFRKSAWRSIGGLDNRLLIWGSEDEDFFNRLRRAGVRPQWLTAASERIFHIWHPSDSKVHDGIDYRRANRAIVMSDASLIRNVSVDNSAPRPEAPVTVVIATRNRATYLQPCLESIREQTVLPAQVIVLDDGSSDNTTEVVTEFVGLNIKNVTLPHVGIARARNIGTALCTTPYLCVMDDDDLMLPDRISDHLAAFEDGVDFTHGGWIEFESSQKALRFYPGKRVSTSVLMYSGRAYTHSATMYATHLLREFPYLSAFTAGEDFDANARMVLAGANGKHTSTYVLLRRSHEKNVTLTNAREQRITSKSKIRQFLATQSEERIDELSLAAKSAQACLLKKPSKAVVKNLIGFSAPAFYAVNVSRDLSILMNLVEDDKWKENFCLSSSASRLSGDIRFHTVAVGDEDKYAEVEEIVRRAGLGASLRLLDQGIPRVDHAWDIPGRSSRLMWSSGTVPNIREAFDVILSADWKPTPIVHPDKAVGYRVGFVSGLIPDDKLESRLRAAQSLLGVAPDVLR